VRNPSRRSRTASSGWGGGCQVWQQPCRGLSETGNSKLKHSSRQILLASLVSGSGLAAVSIALVEVGVVAVDRTGLRRLVLHTRLVLCRPVLHTRPVSVVRRVSAERRGEEHPGTAAIGVYPDGLAIWLVGVVACSDIPPRWRRRSWYSCLEGVDGSSMGSMGASVSRIRGNGMALPTPPTPLLRAAAIGVHINSPLMELNRPASH
jgi:hypothetical protein